MRSPREIVFRLRQEWTNLVHLVFRRRAAPPQSCPLGRLPAPAEVAAALRGSAQARKIESLARLLLRHRFPILGFTVATGPEIDWRRDYVHGKTTGRRYFRLIPYLNFAATGDHKVVWELNRHQHWVVLAQAFLLTGEEEFLEEIWRQFQSWSEGNPYLRSVNWTSALEVAFRALSWTWVYHLAGDRMPEPLRRKFLLGLYRHGLHLESNLSVYFAPNTHLLGEALALHTLGTLFPAFPRAGRWRRLGEGLMREQVGSQVREDGAHFEQSAYYHVYALDMLLWHACVAGLSPELRETISRMAGFLAAVSGPGRRLPSLGDDDGGRLFHPYGPRERFGRATLATATALLEENFGGAPEDVAVQAAWWIGPPALRPAGPRPEYASKLYRDAGLAVMVSGEIQVLVDVGPFGPFRAGHSHSDTLSVVVRDGAEDVLIDPGTYTYVSDQRWRDWFRGSAAHNTIRVDEKDQALAAGSFGWNGRPEVRVEQWIAGDDLDFVDAVCGYQGIRHRRRVLFLKVGGLPRLIVADTVEAEGAHRVEQFWRLGRPAARLGPACFRIGRRARLTLAGPGEVDFDDSGWRSEVFGHKARAPVVRLWLDACLPVHLAAMLDFAAGDGVAALNLAQTGDGVELDFLAGTRGRVRFRDCGPPEYELHS